MRKRIPSVYKLMGHGLTYREAVMAQEAMASSMIEGAKPISAKRMAELIKRERGDEYPA